MSAANRDNCTSSPPTWVPFFNFSCLIVLARISSTMANMSGKSRHTYSNFRGKAFSFSPFNMMLAVGLSNIVFIMKNIEFCQMLFLTLLK